MDDGVYGSPLRMYSATPSARWSNDVWSQGLCGWEEEEEEEDEG